MIRYIAELAINHHPSIISIKEDFKDLKVIHDYTQQLLDEDVKTTLTNYQFLKNQMNQKPSNAKDRYALLLSYYSLAMQLNSKLLLVRINPPSRKLTNYISKSNLSLTIFAISTHSNSRVRFSLDVSSVGDNPSECTVMNFINIFDVFIEDFDERIKQIMQQKEKERKVYLYS